MVTEEVMLDLIGQVESNVHQHGWDQLPVLGVFQEPSPGVVTFKSIMFPWQLFSDGIEAFYSLINTMTTQDGGVQAFLMSYPDFFGLLFCVETLDKQDQEGRTVMMIDIHGRLFQVYRLRDQEPECFLDERADSWDAGIPQLLLSLLLSVVPARSDLGDEVVNRLLLNLRAPDAFCEG